MSEGAEEAAQPALPPANLQTAGGGDERPRARLPAHESLQTDDQGDGGREKGEEIVGKSTGIEFCHCGAVFLTESCETSLFYKKTFLIYTFVLQNLLR